MGVAFEIPLWKYLKHCTKASSGFYQNGECAMQDLVAQAQTVVRKLKE
jgi:hypothetical protein